LSVWLDSTLEIWINGRALNTEWISCMKKSVDNLNSELDDLLDNYKRQQVHQNKGRLWEYENLVKAYLWWRIADKKDGYLLSVYEKAGIEHRKTFNPLLKLLYGWQQKTEKAKISQHSVAMGAVHHEYENNKHLYKGDAVIRNLVAWIKSNGGITQIRNTLSEKTDEFGPDQNDTEVTTTPPPNQKNKKNKDKKHVDDALKTERKVLQHRKELIKQAYSGNMHGFDEHQIGPVVASDMEKLVVLLARKNETNGKLSIVGNSIDPTLINDAILKIGHLDMINLQSNLRAIAEIMRIGIIPKQLFELGLDKDLYQDSNIESDINGKKYRFKQFPRLKIQADGTLFISRSCALSSIVAILKPEEKFEVDEDIFLRGTDRKWLEEYIINSGTLSLYRAKNSIGLMGAKRGTKSVARMELTNSVTQDKRNLYFYSVGDLEDQTVYQAMVKQSIAYDWEIKGTKRFFRDAFKTFFESLIAGMKGRVKIPRNKSIKLVVHSDSLEIQSKWDSDINEYQQQGSHFTLSFDQGTSSSSAVQSEVTISPIDAYRVFESFDTYDQIDDIKMIGNNHIIKLSWTHDGVGQFEAYIPACSTKGLRDNTCFEVFE